jgi:hypothetical protein
VTDELRSLNDKTSDALEATPAFMLLFSVELKADFKGFTTPHPGVAPMPPEHERDYVEHFDDFEKRLLGETFQAARRIIRWPLGRIAFSSASDTSPSQADVFLLVHKSGVALWEIWLTASEQPFDVRRWISWLDPETDDGIIARLWHVLTPINQALTGKPTWTGAYFPVTVLRLPKHPLENILDQHGPDIIRLLFLNQADWTLKRELVREELERDYCAREGGMTLFGRRSGLDLQASESLSARVKDGNSLPPKTSLPIIITLELLQLERAVLKQLYERLSQGMPNSVDELLLLKRQMLDALEEYYGVITTATRFSDAVTVDGERLLGIADLYDAVMNRLEAVSFEITTRYQKRMTTLQFWLTIVFGATEIGFIASSIATWYYHTELSAVLAWTVGAALVSGSCLVALLRGQLK